MIRMAGNAFTLEGVGFSYGSTRVFKGLDLVVREGAVTTLLGANGSGKTTLFNVMTKRLKPQEGRVFLRAGNVADVRPADFAKLVSVVHQHNMAPADAEVRTLVGYGRSPYRKLGVRRSLPDREQDARMIEWALATCDLKDVEHRVISSLSGGQRQRVWMAMALAQGANVLLLDEPTTFLDVRYQLEILKLVRMLNEEHGMTVVMVLHDMNQAIEYSDEIVALAHGRIIAQGAPHDVVTPGFLSQVYGVDLDVVRVRGKPYVLAV